PGTLHESIARPEQTGVVGDWHDRRAARHREPGAADVVFAPLAGPHARALRKYHHPESLLEALAAAARDAAQRRYATRAVDRDRAHQREPPAEKRDPQQLALQHQHLGREDLLEGERLPGGVGLAPDQRWAARA